MDIKQLHYQLMVKIDELVAEAECIGKRAKYYRESGAPQGNVNKEHLDLLAVLRQLQCCKALVIEKYPKYERIFNELLPLLEATHYKLLENLW